MFIKFYSVSPSSKKDEEECLDEAIDKKVVAQERQKEAIDDFAEEDREILDKPTILEELGDDEPLSYQGNVTNTVFFMDKNCLRNSLKNRLFTRRPCSYK